MRIKINYKLFFFLLLIACDDVLEEDISNDMVEILSPTNNQSITGNTVQFTWNELEGADDYRIQVNQNQTVVLDSLVSGQSFSYGFNSGDYSWRIKGQNFAYQTEFTFPIDFNVQASDDLSNQTLVLNLPSDAIYVNSPNTIFSWNTLETADYYEFELIKNLNIQQIIYQQSNINESNINLDASLFDEDAEYIWNVRAHNTSTNTQTEYSSRSVFIDTQLPNSPTLSAPDDQTTIQTTTTVIFEWSISGDIGTIQSNVSSEIEIATDNTFNNIISTQITSSNTYQYVFNTSGDYFWRVRAKDKAGNESTYSNSRTLTVE